MAPKTFKVADRLRTAAAALKSGHLDEARAAYLEILEKFPGSAKAKTGLQTADTRIAAQPRQTVPPPTSLGAQGGLDDIRISGIEDPLQLPKRPGAPRQADPALAHLNTVDDMLTYGRAAEAKGDHSTAIKLYQTVLARDPRRLDVQNDLGLALLTAGQTQRSIEVLQDLARRAPDIPEAHINLAMSLVAREMYPEAAKSCERALKIAPTHPVALCNLGSIYARTGQLDAATAQFEASVTHNPTHADAFVNICIAKRMTQGDPLIAKMQSALETPHLQASEKAKFHFALGKTFDDIDSAAAAFEHFTQANELSKSVRAFDVAQEKNALVQLQELFDADDVPALTHADISENAVTPIFIVGMPRSGSTLIEQVFARHSQISAAGEIDDFPRVQEACLATASGARRAVDRQALLTLRRQYLARLKLLSHGKPYVTDKNLLNFRSVGLIASAFPEAIIVHMKRDPVAVCWSNYKQNFASDRFSFAFDLDDMGAYYSLYAQMMEVWHDKFPGRIVDVDYDAFTQDPRTQTRALLDRCGLGFEEACLTSQDSDAVVTSASLFQVRQKIYRGSSRQWEKYRPYLAPFIAQYFSDA